MADPVLSRFLPLNRLRVALAALVLLVIGTGISVLSFDVMRQIEAESETKVDNVQWALSQIEVELLHLVLAVDAARDGTGSLADLRLKFDVFYSRLNTLKEGSVFAGLRASPQFAGGFDQMSRFMVSSAAVVDGPDAALRAKLDDLSTGAKAMITQARRIALVGVGVMAESSDQTRNVVERTLIQAGILTAVLVASLLAMVVWLLQLYRHNRLRAAENLATMSRLDAVVATALEALVTIDGSGRIVDFNAAACQTFGYSRIEAVGLDMAELVALDDSGTGLFRKGAAPHFEGQGRVRMRARRKDGSVFPAEVAISRTQSGDDALFVTFLRDLSAQLAAEQALVAARDEALAGEKAKADLLVIMSHEIRTPLNGMIGTIELLDETDLQPHQREYLRIMEASGQLLMHHVNDVLDIARLDSGKAPFKAEPVDLNGLVREVIENQMPACREKANEMTYTPPEDGRSRVVCDGAQLRQVLLNLVGNAVKFTQCGRISIVVSHQGVNGPTEIVVADTGVGIPPADLGRIFDDFVTLDASYARRASGTGLGLGIVRRIVDQMGGRLTVESAEGKGSVFRVFLPLEILEEASEGPQMIRDHFARTGDRRQRILVVEDNEFNRLIVRDMLVNENHEVVEAQDGDEGVALASASRFDLILMDISMPRVDGLQAAQAIHSGSGASRNCPIVAMTAHAMQAEAERFRAAGMQQVLIKPITREALRAVVPNRATGAVVNLEPNRRNGDALVDPEVRAALALDLGPAKADQLTRRFLDEGELIVAHSVQQCAEADIDAQVMRDLHRLAGSAGMFGAQALETRLAEIETAWKTGARGKARATIGELEALWRETTMAFQDGVLAQPSSLRYSVDGETSSTRAALGTDPL